MCLGSSLSQNTHNGGSGLGLAGGTAHFLAILDNIGHLQVVLHEAVLHTWLPACHVMLNASGLLPPWVREQALLSGVAPFLFILTIKGLHSIFFCFFF